MRWPCPAMASLTCAPPLQRRGNLHRLAPPQTRVIAAKAAIQVSAPVLQRRPRRARPRKCSTAQRVGRTSTALAASLLSLQHAGAPRRALPTARQLRTQARQPWFPGSNRPPGGGQCQVQSHDPDGLRAGVHAGLFAASGLHMTFGMRGRCAYRPAPLRRQTGAAASARRQTRFISAMRSPLPRFGVMPAIHAGAAILQRCGPVPRGRCRRGMPVTPPPNVFQLASRASSAGNGASITKVGCGRSGR